MQNKGIFIRFLIFFLITSGISGCSPGIYFDFGTASRPTDYQKREIAASASSLTASAQAGPMSIGEERPGQLLSANGKLPPAALPVSTTAKEVNYSSAPALTPPAPNLQAHRKEIRINRLEWKEAVKSMRKNARTLSASSVKEGKPNSAASPSRNPFNQGILAAFLILGLGTGLIVLASLLPSLGSVLAWVVGVSVLLIGVAFLALTLMGFSVRIIG